MKTLLFIALLSIPTAAQANPYVACIQTQLTDRSIDVGPADGLFGNKTKNGVNVLREQQLGLSALPAPSKENASVWCRHIGLELGLQSHWPSSSAAIRIETSDDVVNRKAFLLGKTIRRAHEFLRDTLAVDLPGTLVIVAATNQPALGSKMAAELKGTDTKTSVTIQLEAQCGGRDYISGASYGGVVALCPMKKLGTNEDWTNAERRALDRLVVHELAHEFQTQLVGNFRKTNQQEKQRGPKWLVEGLAIALELEFGVPQLSAAQQVEWFEKQQTYDGKALKAMSRQSVRSDRNFQLHAGYAGVLLASLSSHAAFGTFWEATPDLGWEAAFERAFGQTVETFYNDFGG